MQVDKVSSFFPKVTSMSSLIFPGDAFNFARKLSKDSSFPTSYSPGQISVKIIVRKLHCRKNPVQQRPIRQMNVDIGLFLKKGRISIIMEASEHGVISHVMAV